MKRFLNLNISVINKLHITEICKRHPGTYTIYMNPHNSHKDSSSLDSDYFQRNIKKLKSVKRKIQKITTK